MFMALRLLVLSFFALLGDASIAAPIGEDHSKYAVIGDAGEWTYETETTLKSILQDGTKKLILPGDNLYVGTYASQWQEWLKHDFKFVATAIGNHNGGYKEEMKFFGMPSEYYTTLLNERTRVIVLNSDNTKTSKVQAEFLDTTLAEAEEGFIFLVYHHPTYSVSHLHDWTEKKSFQLAIRPILKKHRAKITALLLGHDHLAMMGHFDDLPFFVSGAVHEARNDRPVNNIQQGVQVSTDWYFDLKPHWLKLDIDKGEDEAKLTFIRSSDSRTGCVATIVTGQRAKLSDECRSL